MHALVQAHGAFAWCGIVALIAALSVSRGGRRGANSPSVVRLRAFVALLGIGVVSGGAAFVTGAWLHAPFQNRLRQKLFLASSALGWLFERKEHVAFGALALLGCAACAAIGERIVRDRDEAAAKEMRRAQVIAMACAILFEAFAIAVSYAARVHVQL